MNRRSALKSTGAATVAVWFALGFASPAVLARMKSRLFIGPSSCREATFVVHRTLIVPF